MCRNFDNPLAPKMASPSPSPFKRKTLALVLVLLLVGVLGTPAFATSYTTNFPKAEPLISEDGHWITARTTGVDWHATLCGGNGDRHVSSVSTAPGYASGPTAPPQFGDALALLTGTWKPDQTAQATVRVVSPSGWPEVEIRLRTSPRDATGYEIMWSAKAEAGERYLAIATWNGPSSPAPHYTILKQLNGPEYGVVTGDVVKGTMIGNTITAYKNGKMQFQITDNKFSQGNPGFGFNEGPSGIYGITSFTALDSDSGPASDASIDPDSLRGAGAGATAIVRLSSTKIVQSLPATFPLSPAGRTMQIWPAPATSQLEIRMSQPCQSG
jgi:hypothetical protein